MSPELTRLFDRLATTPPKLRRQRRDLAEQVRTFCRGLADAANPEAVQEVLAAIQPYLVDPDDEIQGWMEGAVSSFGVAALPVLVDMTGKADVEVRRRLVSIFAACCVRLDECPASFGPVVDEWLLDVDDCVRAPAIKIASRMQGDIQSVVARIAPFLSDRSDTVRTEAVYWLGYCAHFREADLAVTADQLLSFANGTDSKAKLGLARFLADIPVSGARKVEAVLALLREQDTGVVGEAARFVGESADGTAYIQAVPILIRELSLRRTTFIRCCEALANIGPYAADQLPILHDLAHDSEPFRAVHLAETIWKVSNDAGSTVPILTRALQSGHTAAAEAACDVLYRIGRTAAQAIPSLVEVLAESDSYDLNWAITDALGAIGTASPSAVSALVTQLNHPSPIVRSSAMSALERVGAAAVADLEKVLRSIPWWHFRRRHSVRDLIDRIRSQ